MDLVFGVCMCGFCVSCVGVRGWGWRGGKGEGVGPREKRRACVCSGRALSHSVVGRAESVNQVERFRIDWAVRFHSLCSHSRHTAPLHRHTHTCTHTHTPPRAKSTSKHKTPNTISTNPHTHTKNQDPQTHTDQKQSEDVCTSVQKQK